MKLRIKIIFTALVLEMNSSLLYALDLSYTVEGGVASSDNITRVQNNQQSDEVISIGGEISVNDNSSINDFNFDMELRHLQYVDNTFSDETIANIDLNSRWGIVKETFNWHVDGFYGQQAINPFAVVTPENLENIGSLSTGPEIIANFTSRESAIFNYRFTDYYAEITDADYQSNLYSLSLNRRLSPRFTASINSSYEDIKYKDLLDNNFSDLRYGLSLSGRSATMQYGLSLGKVEIEFENGVKVDSVAKSARLTRQLNSANSLSLSYLETVDTGARSINRDNTSTLISDVPFTTDQAQIAYTYNRGALDAGLTYSYAEQDFIEQNNNLDRNITSSVFNVNYGVPVNLRIGLSFNYLKTDFFDPSVDQVDYDKTLAIRFEKRIARDLNAVMSLQRYNRSSTAITNDITENIYRLSLRYSGRI